jgi:hypothetical protein
VSKSLKTERGRVTSDNDIALSLDNTYL